MALWTQSVNLRWRPELKYFEGRTTFLRELESAGLLTAFRWRGNALDVRIGEFEYLRIGVASARLDVFSPRASGDRIRIAAKLALDQFAPSDVEMMPMRLRYLLPIDADASTTQIRTAQLVANELGNSAKDWALLVDGYSDPLDTGYQVEYGIVSLEEMAARLTGSISRLNRGNDEVEQTVDLEGLPPCGLFLDVDWGFSKPLNTDDVYDQAESIWRSAVAEGESMAHRIAIRLNAISDEQYQTGAQ